jgi:hypothetical protein
MRIPFRVAIVALLAAAGCKGILDVEVRGKFTEQQLEGPGLLPVLVNGVASDLECAWDRWNLATSWLSDEYEPNSYDTYSDQIARRQVAPSHLDLNAGSCDVSTGSVPMYIPLQIARHRAEEVLLTLGSSEYQSLPTRDSLAGIVRAYGGYAYLALGEGYDSVAFGDGRHWPHDSALTRADAWFSAAILKPANASILNLARVGRARVRLDRGDKAGAAADAALVPAGFAVMVTREDGALRRANSMSGVISNTVSAAYRAMTVGSSPDPRVTIVFDPLTSRYRTTKYPTPGTPHRLASYKEARYILAEALGGQPAVDIINELRDSLGLAHFASTDPLAIQNAVLDERRREFFAEGAIRLNDLIRLGLTWKTGADPLFGKPYGTTIRLPLPLNERSGLP